MPTAGAIALLVVGAVLTFALTGSVRGTDLNIVGIILMLAGALGLLLPLLKRTRSRSNRPVTHSRLLWNRTRTSRPAARSRQDVIDDDRLTPGRRRPWEGKRRG